MTYQYMFEVKHLCKGMTQSTLKYVTVSTFHKKLKNYAYCELVASCMQRGIIPELTSLDCKTRYLCTMD